MGIKITHMSDVLQRLIAILGIGEINYSKHSNGLTHCGTGYLQESEGVARAI